MTAMATPSSTNAKAAKMAEKASWRMTINPAIVSALWINSVYMERGVFSINVLFISETVLPSSI